jgi:peroxiredoxin family protein
MTEQKNKLTLIVLSGDFDKVFAAFTIASGAAAAGMEVVMFFTFWGIKAIQTGRLTGKGLFGRMAGLMNRGGLGALGPSRLNMGGMGRWMFKLMMKQKGVASLPELRQAALDLGVEMLPCETSMQVLEITAADLIPEAKAAVGVAAMLEHAKESSVQFFI